MEIKPVNALIHRKDASFDHLVWMVSTLNGLHTSSELMHFMIHQLPVDTSSTLQEAHRLSNYVRGWVICIATLKPQAFLDVNTDEVTIDTINKPAKQSPRIKSMRFCGTTKGGDLDIRISPGDSSSFEFCLRFPQHSWGPLLDEVQVLSSPNKVLHFPSSSMKSSNGAAPRTTERQTIYFENDYDGSESDNDCQPNDDASEKTTNPSASAAFAYPRMSKNFKNCVLQEPDIMGHLTSCTAKNSSMIPLGSNLGSIMNLNRTRKLTIHGESWNNSLMLVNLMSSFLYVICNTLVLILTSPRFRSRRRAMRSLSFTKYVRMGNSGR